MRDREWVTWWGRAWEGDMWGREWWVRGVSNEGERKARAVGAER